jgi:hypothetical protein
VSDTWEAVNLRLVGAMLSLDLYDSLTVGDRRQPERRSLLGRQIQPGPRRFVQITAVRTRLIAECVGSTSFGGDWPMSPDQEETLRRQGWQMPWSEEVRTFQREAPLVGAPRLALATVRALELLGCEPSELEYERGREERSGG